MAIKHMKRGLTSPVIRAMQIKTIIRSQLHPLGWLLLKKMKRLQCWGARAETGTLWITDGMETGVATVETLWRPLKKLETEPACDPAAPRLGMAHRIWNSVLKGLICYTQNHNSVIHKSWNMEGTPVLTGWMEKQICYTHMMEYHSALKRKEILIHNET